ncbi:MAG: hypothetical protein J7577_03720 [Sphingobacteriaceae bacterium]|nr:hypothetical protein [Sphingobacteriaceae bacterium]
MRVDDAQARTYYLNEAEHQQNNKAIIELQLKNQGNY